MLNIRDFINLFEFSIFSLLSLPKLTHLLIYNTSCYGQWKTLNPDGLFLGHLFRIQVFWKQKKWRDHPSPPQQVFLMLIIINRQKRMKWQQWQNTTKHNSNKQKTRRNFNDTYNPGETHWTLPRPRHRRCFKKGEERHWGKSGDSGRIKIERHSLISEQQSKRMSFLLFRFKNSNIEQVIMRRSTNIIHKGKCRTPDIYIYILSTHTTPQGYTLYVQGLQVVRD